MKHYKAIQISVLVMCLCLIVLPLLGLAGFGIYFLISASANRMQCSDGRFAEHGKYTYIINESQADDFLKLEYIDILLNPIDTSNYSNSVKVVDNYRISNEFCIFLPSDGLNQKNLDFSYLGKDKSVNHINNTYFNIYYFQFTYKNSIFKFVITPLVQEQIEVDFINPINTVSVILGNAWGV